MVPGNGDYLEMMFVNRHIQSFPPLKLRETLSGLTDHTLASA